MRSMHPGYAIRLLAAVALFWGCSSSTTSSQDDVQVTLDGRGSDGVCFCFSNAECDDGNPCTVDLCGADCACQNTLLPEDSECSPANACLLDGKCHQGVCVSAGTVVCEDEDGNPCTAPKCNAGAKEGEDPCAELPEDDGTVISSYCAQRECQGGVVAATTPTPEAVACEQADGEIDGDGCVESMACDDIQEACVSLNKPDGSPCFPGTDKCMGFACSGGECKQDPELDVICDPPADCEESSCLQCTEFKCDPKDGACKAKRLEGQCDDGNECTTADACVEGPNPMYGTCKGANKECDDGKVCTVDDCDPSDGHCINLPKDENCPGSNNPCVSQLFCDPLATEATDPNLDGCVVVLKTPGTPCNDSDLCTTSEECKDSGGALLCLGSSVDVDDGKPCTNDWCDPELGPQHQAIPDCEEPCNPGEQMDGECGKCGVHSKICPASGKWKDAPWSDCENEGVCVPGAAKSADCGNCGTAEVTCLDNCQWSAFDDCKNEGECTPADSLFEACEGACSNKQKTCDSECKWGVFSECKQSGECAPGKQESVDCEKCGIKSHVCTNGCVWGPWTQCQNQGTCTPGAQQSADCGICGTKYQTCTNQCAWGQWGGCIDPCQCVNGQEELCNPSCGVFDTGSDGLKTCSNGKWGECKAAWCVETNWPVLYPVAPNDFNWHCEKVPNQNFYLCVKVVLSWICADYLEVDLKKSLDINGNQETGPWDNDIKVVLRNVANGATYSQSKVQCAGNTSTNGGCFFDVGNTTLTNTLGVQDFNQLEVDIYSPFTAPTPVGKTGKVSMQRCF